MRQQNPGDKTCPRPRDQHPAGLRMEAQASDSSQCPAYIPLTAHPLQPLESSAPICLCASSCRSPFRSKSDHVPSLQGPSVAPHSWWKSKILKVACKALYTIHLCSHLLHLALSSPLFYPSHKPRCPVPSRPVSSLPRAFALTVPLAWTVLFLR